MLTMFVSAYRQHLPLSYLRETDSSSDVISRTIRKGTGDEDEVQSTEG